MFAYLQSWWGVNYSTVCWHMPKSAIRQGKNQISSTILIIAKLVLLEDGTDDDRDLGRNAPTASTGLAVDL
jgi:hypothetical protein